MNATIAARTASGSQASTSLPAAVVRQRFPCRDAVISQLVQAVATMDVPVQPVMVVGPAATAKTTIVRALLRTYGLRHAYVDCIELGTPRALLCSVLHQLKGGKRLREDGYETGVKCDSMSEFLVQLPMVAAGAPHGRGRTNATTVDADGGSSSARGAACWVVVDHAERLAGTELLAGLMGMGAVSQANVGLILISSLKLATGMFHSLSWGADVRVSVTEIEFPAYTASELRQIMEELHRRSGQDDPGYSQFLKTFVQAFSRTSNSLPDLQAAVNLLYPLYCQPLRDGKAVQATGLYKRIEKQIKATLSDMDFYGSTPAAGAAAAGEDQGARNAAGANRRASSGGLKFELPFVSKFLLLAAYVASRNKPATDRAVFDPTFHKRMRGGAQAHDRLTEAAVEAKLRGPHSFTLERLLQIFFVLYSHHGEEEEDEEEDEQATGGLRDAARREMLQGEVLMQVASLVGLRQLSQSSGDLLEGQVYRCNLTEAAAHAIAKNLKVDLGSYLKLA